MQKVRFSSVSMAKSTPSVNEWIKKPWYIYTMDHSFQYSFTHPSIFNKSLYSKSSKYSKFGEPFQAWEMWLIPHSEKPVGSEVGGQDPRPWISSPVGNQACIVPRLLWDLLLLKLPHPELRKQMFAEYFYLPRIWADPPGMGQSRLDHFSFCIANVLLWCIQWHPLCCQQKITTQDKPLYSKRGPSLMLRAWKTYKGWLRQGSECSPLEGVAEAIRGTLLLREWPRHRFSPTGPLLSVCVCVCVCVCVGILKPQQQILRAEICITVLLSGGCRYWWVRIVLCGHHIQNDWASKATNLHQILL